MHAQGLSYVMLHDCDWMIVWLINLQELYISFLRLIISIGIWCGSTVLYNAVILFTNEDESNTEDEGLTDAAGQEDW